MPTVRDPGRRRFTRWRARSMPYVRADWFVANASRPPLYHTLLDLPGTPRLERQLEVDVAADFLRDRLGRAGFATSGVSSQNRLVDRHHALHGAYWKSYDFKNNEGTGNLFRFPLGPVFGDNPFAAQAFEHAGGEIIFNLPNGLQGYLLVDAKDHRIDAGPIEVVSDALKTSGTAAIVPGLSCMACHQHGIDPASRTRSAPAWPSPATARDKAERLFLAKGRWTSCWTRTRRGSSRRSTRRAGPFLKVGEDQNKTIRDFPEPIGAVARPTSRTWAPTSRRRARPGRPEGRCQRRSRPTPAPPARPGPAAPRAPRSSEPSGTRSTGGSSRTFQEVARELELGTPFRSF